MPLLRPSMFTTICLCNRIMIRKLRDSVAKKENILYVPRNLCFINSIYTAEWETSAMW